MTRHTQPLQYGIIWSACKCVQVSPSPNPTCPVPQSQCQPVNAGQRTRPGCRGGTRHSCRTSRQQCIHGAAWRLIYGAQLCSTPCMANYSQYVCATHSRHLARGLRTARPTPACLNLPHAHTSRSPRPGTTQRTAQRTIACYNCMTQGGRFEFSAASTPSHQRSVPRGSAPTRSVPQAKRARTASPDNRQSKCITILVAPLALARSQHPGPRTKGLHKKPPATSRRKRGSSRLLPRPHHRPYPKCPRWTSHTPAWDIPFHSQPTHRPLGRRFPSPQARPRSCPCT